MATYRTILTKKGKELIAAAGASGIPIVLSDMAVGDGNGNAVTPVETQTTLARERYRHAVNQLTVDVSDASRFTAELLIPASVGGFTMREVGLYTNNGDLFAVANVPASYKPTDTEGSFGDTAIRMVFIVANASVVTLVADPNVAVATHSWVMNNVNAATIIPGGLTGQFLAKKSNANGDIDWVDPTQGITVIVFSREETQTLAAGQTVVDLAQITAEGVAVYIEGTRLRAAEFSVTGDSQITLASAHPAGSKVTAVQNEEVGATDVLLRPLNLADVPDKAVARNNLGLPNWLATSNINWNQLINVPAYALRWADWPEVTNKPTTFPPSAHSQDWSTIDGKPDTATRWPTWNEVTGKPSTFTPSTHTHAISDVSGLSDALNSKLGNSGNQSLAGSLTLPPVAGLPISPDGDAARQLRTEWQGIAGSVEYLSVNFVRKASGTDWQTAAWRIQRQVGGTAVGYIEIGGNNESKSVVLGAYISGTAWLTNQGAWGASGGFDFGSSRKLKLIEGEMPYGLEHVRKVSTLIGKYKPEYNKDGRTRLFFDAEQLATIIPEAVDENGVEFNGEMVPVVKIDQVLPPAYRAISELAEMVENLSREVAALKAGK